MIEAVKKQITLLKHCFVILLSLSPLLPASTAIADDTEIFFGHSNPADANSKPNVLFILDNSGSMNAGLMGSTRMQVMKDAFAAIISEVNGINASVMQFTYKRGGAVNQSFLDLDATDYRREIPSSSFANKPQQSAQQTLAAEANPTPPNPALGTILDNGRLYTITTNSGALGFASGAGQENYFSRRLQSSADDRSEALISNSNDDDDEGDSGNWQRTETSQYLHFGPRAYTGLRFRNIDIPPTATIVSATISFTGHPQYASNSEQVDMQIRGFADPNPPSFSISGVPVGTLQNLWQSQTTDANKRWSIGQRFETGEPYRTADFSNVVQEIIQSNGWTQNNPIMILLSHDSATDTSGIRSVYSHASGRSNANPTLNITWVENAEQVPIQTGLHFSDVNIPQGAEIVSAALVLHAAADSRGDLELNITAEKTEDASLFPDGASVSTSGQGPLAILPKTRNYVNWGINVDWTNGSSYQTPDLSSIFQEIIDQPNWCGGNRVNVLLEPSSSSTNTRNSAQRFFGGSENSLGLYPELRLAYRLNNNGQNPGCFRRSITRAIATNSDDGHETDTGTINRNGANIRMSQDRFVALRFDGLGLTRGADILQARLNVRAREAGAGPATFNVWVENTGDSQPLLSTPNSFTQRSRIGPVVWTVNEDWNVGQSYNSGDIGLNTLITRAMAQSNWAPGQAITVLIEKTAGSNRVIYAHDDRPSFAASLTLVADASDYATNISFSNKDVLISRVNDLRAVTWTPIVDTLYEAALYNRGEAVDWGKKRLQDGWRNAANANVAGSLRVSHPDSYTGGDVRPRRCADSAESNCAMEEIRGSAVYESPIDADCQSNHIVLLTDGQANYNSSESRIRNLIGGNCITRTDGETCAPELARFLQNTNQHTSFQNSTITTHTIAFALNPANRGYQFMEAVANAGGGTFADASNLEDLKNAFNNILTDIQDNASTFAQPSLSVNQFNQLYHRRELYFSMFQPSSSAAWPGNVKGYKMEMQADGSTRLVDAFGQLAVDPITGFFRETSRSYWSRGTDGSTVTRGGVVDNLPVPGARRLFTFLKHSLDDPNSRNLALTADQNAFIDSNPIFIAKPELLGTPNVVEMREAVRWARGYDVLDADGDDETNEPRFSIGDPLHSSPVMVTYGGDNNDPVDVLFVGNNDGFLRSIDAMNGRENWGFVPEELLGLQGNLFRNQNLFTHLYGLDNTPVVWTYDAEKDGRIDDANDRVFVYATMRRGGRNIYALDATDKDAPRVMWVKRGGEDDGYSALGQTWSTPVVTKIQIGSEEPRLVLIMGGGYDLAHDDDMDTMINSSMGNAVYIIDAITGEIITHATKSVPAGTTGVPFAQMDHAFPTAPTTFDHNVDGLVDQVYIPDIAGKIWRFDILNGQAKENILKGGVIASLGGTSATGGPRRFFSKIDLSLVLAGGRLMLAVAVGSGEATSPLNTTIENRFFVITQRSPFTDPVTYNTITERDLTDITDGVNGAQPLTTGGFYRRLGPGEKIVSSNSSSTFDGTILFSTYTPGAGSQDACQAPRGLAKMYAMKVSNGQAALDLNGDGNIAEEDISLSLKASTLPAAPTILILEGSTHPVVMVGTEAPLEDMGGGGLNFVSEDWQKVFWENHR